MERVEALIKRIDELYHTKASNEEILLVTQMLTTELQSRILKQKVPRNISVIMPATAVASKKEEESENERKQITTAPVQKHEQKEEPAVAQTKLNNVTIEKKKPELSSQEEISEPVNVGRTNIAEKKDDTNSSELPDANFVPFTFNLNEIASIGAVQADTKVIEVKKVEINELMAKKELSLNDRLRMNNSEIGNKLKETPIRDLKKAIGVNERYTFIQELFRGDEIMYERSIKTINSFSVLPEAKYWIQRELKVKIGWDDDSDAVKEFDQLVRRRFASI